MICTLTPRHITPWVEHFFSGNVLLLEDPDTEGLNYENRLQFLERIRETVVDHNIETIVLDIWNPTKINDNDGRVMEPTLTEILNDLSQITTSYLIVCDYTYFYQPHPNIIFFSWILWIISQKLIEEYVITQKNSPPYITNNSITVYDIPLVKKTQTVMSLNMNATWHRIYLFSLLAGKTWFNQIGYSFHAITGYDSSISFQQRLDMFVIKKYLSSDECELAAAYGHLLPVCIPNDQLTNRMWYAGSSGIDSPVYNEYAINLVTETSLTEGIGLSEKTAKPFMAYQIPIIVGPVGVTKFFEDMGLDMFSDYIPWRTWDQEPDHKTRIRMIVEFLDRLLSSPSAEQDILRAHESFAPRLLKNKEHFHSTDFANLLTQQIRNVKS